MYPWWLTLIKLHCYHVPFIILNYHAKNQLKRTSGSWDIKFSKIERFDWPWAFLAITWEQRFRQTCGFHQNIELINTFRLNIISTTSSWLDFLQKSIKSEKNSFLGYFGPFYAQIWQNGGFAEKSGSVTFFPLWSPNIMQNIRKN